MTSFLPPAPTAPVAEEPLARLARGPAAPPTVLVRGPPPAVRVVLLLAALGGRLGPLPAMEVLPPATEGRPAAFVVAAPTGFLTGEDPGVAEDDDLAVAEGPFPAGLAAPTAPARAPAADTGGLFVADVLPATDGRPDVAAADGRGPLAEGVGLKPVPVAAPLTALAVAAEGAPGLVLGAVVVLARPAVTGLRAVPAVAVVVPGLPGVCMSIREEESVEADAFEGTGLVEAHLWSICFGPQYLPRRALRCCGLIRRFTIGGSICTIGLTRCILFCHCCDVGMRLVISKIGWRGSRGLNE